MLEFIPKIDSSVRMLEIQQKEKALGIF